MESQDPHKSTSLRMNLAAVKRADPYAKEIVETSAHVAFYTFNYEGEEWEKTDVEGAFFVYKRTAEPFHSIFINNRLNTNSLVEPITADLELQSQPPFLLYRNERSRIRGFWFYNKDELERVAGLVNNLIKECQTRQPTSSNATTAADQLTNLVAQANLKANQATPTTAATNGAQEGKQNGGGVGGGPGVAELPKKPINIFSMLSKAQEDFHNSMNGPKLPLHPPPQLMMPGGVPPPMVMHAYHPPPQSQPMPMPPMPQQMDGGVLVALLNHPHPGQSHNGGPPPPVLIGPPVHSVGPSRVAAGKDGVTSKSVMNFFASAVPQPQPHPHGGVPMPGQHSNNGPGGAPVMKVGSPAPPPLLQRLMSNPVHTVEQIEMQHRVATPQDIRPATSDVHAAHVSTENGFNWNGAQGNPPQGASSKSDTWASLFNAKAAGGDNGGEGKELTSGNENAAGTSGLFKMLQDAEKSGGVVFNSTATAPTGATTNATAAQEKQKPVAGTVTKTASKPALMPPTMFKKTSEPLSAGDMPTNPSLIATGTAAAAVTTKREATTAVATKKEESGMKPEPLNQSQMLQAMTYLMKNDPQFMRKLHEAYLKSFAEMVAP